ncbi:MAG: hypothetical protein NC914_01385, partial [Candidatus Omnitrophica bacterium]|nr:hypothetical protein [Candidatus Omnitrophota bacterium]
AELMSNKEVKEKRKAHNILIRKKINALEKEKDKLNLERLAKERAITNPRSYRDESSLEEYMLRVEEIKKRLAEIIRQIEKLKKQIIN